MQGLPISQTRVSHRIQILIVALSMQNLSFLVLELFVAIRLLELPEAHVGFA